MTILDQVKVHVLETMEEKERQKRVAIGAAESLLDLETLLLRQGWTMTEVFWHTSPTKGA